MGEFNFSINPVDDTQRAAIQQRIDNQIKPVGSLGLLESIAMQLALLQGCDSLSIDNPQMVLFAADHGIAKHGVSIAPSEVTQQMVANFVAGGAAINCICKSQGLPLTIVDAGMLQPNSSQQVTNQRLGNGTGDFSVAASMTEEQLLQASQYAVELVTDYHQQGSNCLLFGEMGIGNTSSAAAIMHCLTGIEIEQCVGLGTGIDVEQYMRKLELVTLGVNRFTERDPLNVLRQVGGFEIAQLCFAILAAAERKMLVVIDGFIVSAAAALALAMHPECKQSLVFAHQSDEVGHAKLLAFLGAEPLLKLKMRLGEGSAAALAFPLIQSAVSIYNNMASFDSAGVDVP